MSPFPPYDAWWNRGRRLRVYHGTLAKGERHGIRPRSFALVAWYPSAHHHSASAVLALGVPLPRLAGAARESPGVYPAGASLRFRFTSTAALAGVLKRSLSKCDVS